MCATSIPARVATAVLRGNCDFETIKDYRRFVDELVARRNKPRGEALQIELTHLKPLPARRTADFTEIVVPVVRTRGVPCASNILQRAFSPRRATVATLAYEFRPDEPREWAFRDRLEEFKAKTGIDVQIDTFGFEDLFNKALTASTGRTGEYDIFQFHYPDMALFDEKGFMVDITEWIERDAEEMQLSDIHPAMQESHMKWDGSRADKDADRKQKQQDYRERIPIEGKFGQGKGGYQLNYIRARTARTSEAWIRSIFMVMNLLVLIRILLVRRLKHQILHAVLTSWTLLCKPKTIIGVLTPKQNRRILSGTSF